MNLSDKFSNYEQQPDPKVWDSVSQTLKHRALVRRRIITGSITAVILSAVSLWALSQSDSRGTDNKSLVVAQPITTLAIPAADSAPASTATTAVPVSNETTSVPTTTDQSPVSESLPTYPAHDNQPVILAPDAPKPVAVANPTQSLPTHTLGSTSVSHSNSPAVLQPKPKTPSTIAATPTSQKLNPITDNQELSVYIPNAFSPDDPGCAEVRTFRVFPNSDSQISNYKIYIYNRNGHQVFHSTNVSQSWDGTANGQPQPRGSYVYIIEYKDAVKGLQHIRGIVTLIR